MLFVAVNVACHRPEMKEIRRAPHNDVSVNDGPHNDGGPIILFYIIIPLCYNCLQYSVQ